MLKLSDGEVAGLANGAAAFGRLCVETILLVILQKALEKQPPSGGCVLKLKVRFI